MQVPNVAADKQLVCSRHQDTDIQTLQWQGLWYSAANKSQQATAPVCCSVDLHDSALTLTRCTLCVSAGDAS